MRLVDAPNKDAIQKAHDEAHGDIPSEIMKIDPAVVAAFFGKGHGSSPTVGSGSPQLDAALRAIMFTDLKGSTAMTTRLGDTKALHLLHIHNSLTRNALRGHTGREVKHLGDGIMASFASIDNALQCAIAIQRAFATYNVQNSLEPLRLRIGLSVGEPVEEDGIYLGGRCNWLPDSARTRNPIRSSQLKKWSRTLPVRHLCFYAEASSH